MSMPTILDDQLQELLLQMEQFGRENDQRENDSSAEDAKSRA